VDAGLDRHIGTPTLDKLFVVNNNGFFSVLRTPDSTHLVILEIRLTGNSDASLIQLEKYWGLLEVILGINYFTKKCRGDEYIEFISKINQYQFKDIKMKNKCICAYALTGNE